MSILKFSSPFIFLDGKLQENRVVITDIDGTILDINYVQDHDETEVRFLNGAILPGFVNAHCHLELSHMKGLVDTGTTLLPFIGNVVKHRHFSMEDILAAIQKADSEMIQNGIVAVGDISNKTDTAACKAESPIRYYTFVEMFDFMQKALTSKTIEQYLEVYHSFKSNAKDRKSLVPHAPYSVSPELFHFISTFNNDEATVSIHNQETLEEDKLFREKKGGFLEFYSAFGFSLDDFEATGHSSLSYAIGHMNRQCKTLMVHNTQTTLKDIQLALQWNNRVYWVTCPNANLYIENRLPNYTVFVENKQKLCIGTDSLTSNWQLCIWNEIQTLQKYCSYLSLEEILTWATSNGAEALGYDDTLGSIEKGKKPGLVNVEISKINSRFKAENSKPIKLL